MALNSGVLQAFAVLFRTSDNRRRSGLGRFSRSVPEILESRALLANHPLTAIPALNSLPGAAVTIYLDFDGHTETEDWPAASTNVGSPVVTPVFDIDNDLTTFSDEELRIITEVWYRVSEDYQPFTVNVSTVSPAGFNNFQAIRVSIGGSSEWLADAPPGVVGVAWLNSFNNEAPADSDVNTCFVFSDSLEPVTGNFAKEIALSASHEAGHTFGLDHHSVYNASGTKTSEYDPGSATLGPIMGNPFGSFRETWSNAAGNESANVLQDDLAVLTRAANQTIAYRNDDFSNTISTANVPVVSGASISTGGFVGRNDDIDMFRFSTNAGSISFTVEGLNLGKVLGPLTLNPGTNLDAVLTLYNGSGTVVATASPTDSLSATLTQTVAAGDYYIAVSGTGVYGSMGQYTLNGTVIPVPAIPSMLGPSGVQDTANPTFTWTLAANAATYDLQVERVVNNVGTLYYSSSGADLSQTSSKTFEEGTYRARVRGVTSTGTTSGYSPYILFSVDIAAPGKPALIDLNSASKVTTSFPTFQWTEVTNGETYTLEVNEILEGAGVGGKDLIVKQVIFRPGNATTSYQHFTPLRDAKYSARVKATNAVGEDGEWSDTVKFTLDASIPAKPKIVAPSATTTNVSPRIEWTGGEDGWKFDIRINYLNQTPSTPMNSFNVVGRNSFETTNLAQGTYTVSVRTINGNEERGPWSDTYTFSVDVLPPDRPKLLIPNGTAASGNVVSLTPTFRWAAAARAETYDLWVNNETTGNSQIIRNSTIKDTFFTDTKKLPEGTYRVWVRARNSAGEFSPWSLPQTFVLDIPAPRVPINLNVTGISNQLITDATPQFTWSRQVIDGELKVLSDNEFYELQVRDLTDNNKLLIDVTNLKGLSYTVPNSREFPDGHRFAVTVRAGNTTLQALGSPEVKQFSSWSSALAFTLQVPAPPVPVVLAPGQSINTNRPTFRWTHDKNGGAVRYEILVRDLLRQENIILNVTNFNLNANQTEASYTLPPGTTLGTGNGNGTYRVWIRSFNSKNVASGWSVSKTFVIKVADVGAHHQGLADKVSDLTTSNESILTLAISGQTEAETEAPKKAAGVFDVAVNVISEPTTVESTSTPATKATISGDQQKQLNQLHDQVMELLGDPASSLFGDFSGEDVVITALADSTNQ